MSHLRTERIRASGRACSLVGLCVLVILLVSGINASADTLSPLTSAGAARPFLVQQNFPLLEYGKPIEQHMRGGERTSYRLTLAAGQLLHAVVDQRGIDVVVTLFGPNSMKIVEVDSPNGTQGPEPVWAIAETSGDYRLEVRSEANVPAGRYVVSIQELRAASLEDKSRVPAEWALQQAKLLLNNGLHRKALEKYEEALNLLDAIPDTSSEAEALYESGLAHYSLLQITPALECFRRALPIYRTLGNRLGEANTFYGIGLVHDSAHENVLALESLKQALPIYKELGNHLAMANTLNLLGRTYDRSADTERALEHFDEALQISQAVPTENGRLVLASVRVNIGGVYAKLGYLEQALLKYEQALPVLQNRSDRRPWATLLINIGQVQNERLKPDEALKQLELALTIYGPLKETSDKAALLNNIGSSYFLKQNRPRALYYYNQALKIWLALRDPSGLAGISNNIAQAIASPARKQETLAYYEQARRIYRQLGDRTNETAVLGNIGSFYESLGQKREALDYYQKGINVLEGLRHDTTIERIRASVSQSSSPFVFKASHLLMSRGEPKRAFDLTEVGRARTFLDQFDTIRPNHLETTNTQLNKERQDLELRLTALEHSLEVDERQPLLEIEYAAAQQQYEEVLIRLQLTDRSLASSRSVRTLALSEIQERLGKDTTLLSYLVLPDKTLAFVITRNSFRAVVIPLKEAKLTDEITWLRRFPMLRNPPSETLKQLYGWLIAPVRHYIKTQTVGIIPHRELHYLPFAALTDGRHYFGDEHILFYLPSASTLPFIQNRRQFGARMLALAQSRAAKLPPLRFADQEARTVASLFNTQALTTGNATKSEFLKWAGESSIIHLVAHAEVNTSSPLFYRIRLAADRYSSGILAVREIYHLNLTKTSLVVLSACQTELGEHNLGDDIVSLNRAFISAGASTVIASLWSVDDEASGILMKSFYTHLKKGLSKADALRQAQRETRLTYPHPYYWAGFVLTGDPGTSTQLKLNQ